jgi:signal transduction histidine kinase/ligand-binding sensor domain-containing protein
MTGSAATTARWLPIVMMLALIFCVPALAQPSEIAISQFHQTQWTAQNGAPSGILDIAQTRDGYIWLLANGRLFRFDGVEFERIQQVGGSPLPSGHVHAIWARPAGGLWISYLFGGAMFIGDDGTSRIYSVADGLPPRSVFLFEEDASGRMWAGTTMGLLWLDGDRWKFVDESWGIPQDYMVDMKLDRDGALWLLSEDKLYFQRRGSRRFERALPAHVETSNASFIGAPDGRVWLAKANSGLTELQMPEPGQPMVLNWRPFASNFKDVLPSALLIDQEWNVWASDWSVVTRTPLRDGERTPQGGSTPVGDMPGQVHLAGEGSSRILHDREGNIWATSSGGLTRFRVPAFLKIGIERIAYGTAALAADDNGSVWISEHTGKLHRFEGGLKRETVQSPHEPFAVLHRDHAGTLWVGGSSNAIYHRRGAQWIEWRPEDATSARGVQAIVSQPDGTLWVSAIGVGVYRVADNRWTLWGGLAGLPREPATAMAIDPAGRLWFGYVDSRIAVVDRGQVTVYDADDGLATGAVQVMAVRGRNIWIGGENGLAWFDGLRFQPVYGSERHPFGSVNGIVERAQGELWLNTSDGAVLVAAGEVRRLVANPGHPVRSRLFDHLDGMPSAHANLRPWPTAVESTDGRLWFSTYEGIVSLAPQLPAQNKVVPDVYIKSITVDGQRTDVDGRRSSMLRLPTRPHVLQIAYTAPSFTIPERVHFRYRLEGSEMGWEDVGTRREAYFTGLPPGSYRFQVIAANDSGLWNETGASLEFVIPPTFLQSRTFLAMCVGVGCAALWLLFVLRMRQVKAKLQWRSEARLLERERIARELHDTFLQGVHGLMLRFQSATERIPQGEPARGLMEDALDRADRVLADGRDKVSELRATVSLGLPEALEMAGNELARDYAAGFTARVEGDIRELDPLVQEEAYRIGAEALTNAFRHAGAMRIGVTTVFGRRQLEVRVTDDGCGFDMSSVKKGRWGLKGLRERAEKIRGTVLLSSKPGAGTTVELRVPAKVAYRKADEKRRGWRKILGGMYGEHSK